jgi:hypothetical protein
LHRECAAVANAALGRTGDPEAPQRAGAETLVVDLDSTTALGRRDRKGQAPGFISLTSWPAAVSRRAGGVGDLSRAIEAIFAGAMP